MKVRNGGDSLAGCIAILSLRSPYVFTGACVRATDNGSLDGTAGCNRYLGTRQCFSKPSGWTSEYVDRPAQGVSAPPQVD